MEINGEGFRLRPWTLDDIPSLALHANNPGVSAHLRDRFPYPYTTEDARKFITHSLEADQTKDSLNLTIEINAAAAGAIGLMFDQDVYRVSAEIGYWLAEPYWGRNIVPRAVNLLVDYAFQHTHLTRIYAGVFESNQASIRVLEKAGFQLEGIRRKSVIKKGVIMDSYLYATIRP